MSTTTGFLSTILRDFAYCLEHVIPLVDQLSGSQAIHAVIRFILLVPILCCKYGVYVPFEAIKYTINNFD